jgi:hypothetical protein
MSRSSRDEWDSKESRMEHAVVRDLIANVERDLHDREVAGAADPTALVELRSAWGALVRHLAIPPAPEMRACPHCGGQMIREATLCKFCWGR